MQPCSATVFPSWVSEPWVNTSLCVSVCVCVAKILQPTFSFTFYSDEVIAFHMPWPASPNDRVGQEAAPQTFGCIIHQPTAPTTNNYILVGGGGWGPVEHCPVNHTHTHTHTHSLYHTHTQKHLNELATRKWHKQSWPKHFEVIFSSLPWSKHQHLEQV